MGDDDKRMVCKYGVKCYQKNPAHHQKYKHPPKRPITSPKNNGIQAIPKKIKLDDSCLVSQDLKASSEHKPKNIPTTIKVSNDLSDSDGESIPEKNDILQNSKQATNTLPKETDHPQQSKQNEAEKDLSLHKNGEKSANSTNNIIPKNIDPKTFIQEKFLLKMPQDFYQFWTFCQEIKPNNPEMAFKDVDLILVGPYDVLSGKFCNKEDKDAEEYLRHWRYYYDPPEFQTVIKGKDSSGYHIGYFRDDPKEDPVFLATNNANVDGCFEIAGSNIFAAVSNYLEDFYKRCTPFQKVNVEKLLSAIKTHAKKLQLELTKKNSRIVERNNKVVAKGFNKMGIVVPYNKKTQLGYRELAMDDKELKALLLKIKGASEEQRDSFIAQMQPLITYATLAIDECDFGTGIELGLNVLFCGVKCLDVSVALRFLQNSYNLLNRKEFSKIAKAHLSFRKKGSDLSIV